jgi:hypothetical protein
MDSKVSKVSGFVEHHREVQPFGGTGINLLMGHRGRSHQGIEGQTETCRLQKRQWHHLVFQSEFRTWNHHSQGSAEVCENPPEKWCSIGLDQAQVVAIRLGGQHEHRVSSSHDSHGPGGTDKVWSGKQGNTLVH